jgi:hypothetical protein
VVSREQVFLLPGFTRMNIGESKYQLLFIHSRAGLLFFWAKAFLFKLRMLTILALADLSRSIPWHSSLSVTHQRLKNSPKCFLLLVGKTALI